MSRMPRGTPNPLPGSAGIPDQRHPPTVPGAPRQHRRRAPRPHGRTDHGEMQRLLGEGLLRPLRALRQESLRGLQVSPHGGVAQRNTKN